MRITIIGTGYVGLVTGTCFAHMGNQVCCIDIDQEKINALSRGTLPIHEPGLQELLDNNLEEGRLTFTTSLPDGIHTSEFIFIAVGTPMGEDGSADLKHVLAVAEEIGQAIKGYKIVVTKSTVPVGTAEKVRIIIQKAIDARGLEIEFDVASNPEFLKEGKAVSDFLNPDRIVIGTDSEKAAQRLQLMYDPFCRTDQSRILLMDIPSAEMTKYAANAMLATRISFMNEIAALCEATGADVDQVRIGIGSDDRIGRRFLFPGVGYGGSCFPKDVQSLIRTAHRKGVSLRVLSAVEEVNRAQKELLVSKMRVYYDAHENGLAGKSIALWGLSFKPETDDVRESPAAVIIQDLLKADVAVRAYDPVAESAFQRQYDLPIEYSPDMYQCLDGAHGLVLVTEWHHFRRPNFDRILQALVRPIIFDGRNQYNPAQMRSRGFIYHSIGRPYIDE
ncbi:MAG: UDP-glucose/GDP-mannose dehydrogenase family protein [Candidatus Marinimicrobia bacterium]|nr:UDP-glucose/GDP-mannose dehydrogenase family protein [Candidatus Neomarinimicrobiota bacterium]